MGNVPHGYCHCGCGEKAPLAKITRTDQGHRKGEPIRFINGHNNRKPWPQRFWDKVEKRGPDECWIWVGTLPADGYGRIQLGGRAGKYALAHRVSYEMEFGPIPDGMLACHHCDVTACVNPRHIFLGDQHDNMRDMAVKWRSQKGERHHNVKLTEPQVAEMRKRFATGAVSKAQLSRDYDISEAQVRDVIARRAWRHV